MLIEKIEPLRADADGTARRLGIPLDLAEELPDGNEGAPCEWHEIAIGGANVGVLWFPNEGRAGCTVVSSGTGDAAWTDADSPEDAAQRYAAGTVTR